MGNKIELRCADVSYKKADPESGTKGATVEAADCISLAGVECTGKIAEGLCPACKAGLELWLTGRGLVLSLPGGEIAAKPPAGQDCKTSTSRDLGLNNSSAPKPLTIDIIFNTPEPVKSKDYFPEDPPVFLPTPPSYSKELKWTIFYILAALALLASLIIVLHYASGFFPDILPV